MQKLWKIPSKLNNLILDNNKLLRLEKIKLMMNSEGLPPVLLSANKRYSLSIPEGRLTPGSGS